MSHLLAELYHSPVNVATCWDGVRSDHPSPPSPFPLHALRISTSLCFDSRHNDVLSHVLQQLGSHSDGPQRCAEFQVFTERRRPAQHGVEAFRRALLVDTVISFHFLNRDGDVLEQTHVGRKVH